MIHINCPVCDRVGVTSDICPNCETNLSTFRLLAKLPPIGLQQTLSLTLKVWLVSTTIVILLIGISLGITGGSLLSQQSSEIAKASTQQISTNMRSANTAVVKSGVVLPSPCISNFYYRVRQGDSLTKIAEQFYGDLNMLKQIVNSNSQLIGREDNLDLNEKLLIPKLYRTCS